MTEAVAEQAQTTGAPPGTSFFAPAVHLLDENATGSDQSDQAIIFGQAGDSQAHPVHVDIERAEVTQVNHGPSQVSVTLNNQRHQSYENPRPISPSWKYNRLDHLKFGQKLVVKFGYAMKEPGSADSRVAPASADTAFQKNLMLRARITDMTFGFPNQGGSKVTLKGEDAMSLLNAKPENDKRYDRQNEVQMVEEILVRSGSGLQLADGPRENLSGTIRSLTHRKGTSYLQFVQELAKRLDYEVWVDIDQANQIHFEKARSLMLGAVIDLSWNRNLVDFKPRFKGWDIYTGATAGGRNPSRRSAIREVVAASEIQSDLHTAPEGPGPITAIQARSDFFTGGGDSDENNVTVDVNNLDTARARMAAVSELRRSAREFLTADATTIGLPHLRPGMHVNIKKLYAPFDGIYYVTHAIHTIDNTGYRTKVKLRRPGMLNPSAYPTQASGA